MTEKQLLIDKLDMFYNRVVDANDEIKMCLSIKNEYDNDTAFYRENFFLNKLYRQLLKIAVVDLFVLTSESRTDKNSINKILNCINNYRNKDEIKDYENLLDYTKVLQQRLENYKQLILRISTVRSTFIAHIDGKSKREEYYNTDLNIEELENLAKLLFKAVVEIRLIILYGQVPPLNNSGHNNYAGINNTFEGLSKKYDRFKKMLDRE